MAFRWMEMERRRRSVCGDIRTFTESSHRYYIQCFLRYSELPYFALTGQDARATGRCLGRYSTLAQAKAACRRHADKIRARTRSDRTTARSR